MVRAFAHEQFARLILKCYGELDLTSESLPLESEITVTDAEGESSDYSLSVAGSVGHGKLFSQVAEKGTPSGDRRDSDKEDSLVISQGSTTNSHVVQTIADPISSRLAAIHHVSQAIKSLSGSVNCRALKRNLWIMGIELRIGPQLSTLLYVLVVMLTVLKFVISENGSQDPKWTISCGNLFFCLESLIWLLEKLIKTMAN